MKKILILLCLCCAAAGLSAETSLPVEAPAVQEEALSSKIKEIADRFRAVNTISARFTNRSGNHRVQIFLHTHHTHTPNT